MPDTKNLLGGLAIGILTGVAIGSVAALLSAPQPGVQTRAQLLEKGDELREKASETLKGTRERASHTLVETRGRADAVLSDVRSRSMLLAERVKGRTNGSTVASTEIIAE